MSKKKINSLVNLDDELVSDTFEFGVDYNFISYRLASGLRGNKYLIEISGVYYWLPENKLNNERNLTEEEFNNLEKRFKGK